MKKPTQTDIDRSIAIRCRARRGETISDDDHNWNGVIFKTYPEWYAATEPTVFNRTVPFGSITRHKENLDALVGEEK